MNILFIGDIFGRPGRETVKKLLPEYKKNHDIDLVIANGENMHHGKGISLKQMEELQSHGVDFFTSGNHIWAKREIIPHLNHQNIKLIRPANYPSQNPGRGYMFVQTSTGKKVFIINVMGRVFMHGHYDCPFRTVDRILQENEHEKPDAIFIDFHGEATSEKAAFANYFDGRVSVVVGTHTHVPTCDERILPSGTAFQTDTGFTGPVDSIIGLEKKSIIEGFISQMPVKHEVAEGPTVFNALKIEIDENSKKALKIERIQRYLPDPLL